MDTISTEQLDQLLTKMIGSAEGISDLLFVAAFSLGQFASLTLSLFLSLALYAAVRQWMLTQMMGNHMLTAERMFAVAMELICTAAQAEAPDGQLANARYGRAALVRRARAIIDDRLADSELSTETVAALVGISPRYLQSVFRSEGSTVAGTIWRRRLDRARRMLDNPMLSGDPVSDVAFSCGFTSAAHFSQKFKSRFHISPRDYRRARRSQR